MHQAAVPWKQITSLLFDLFSHNLTISIADLDTITKLSRKHGIASSWCCQNMLQNFTTQLTLTFGTCLMVRKLFVTEKRWNPSSFALHLHNNCYKTSPDFVWNNVFFIYNEAKVFLHCSDDTGLLCCVVLKCMTWVCFRNSGRLQTHKKPHIHLAYYWKKQN